MRTPLRRDDGGQALVEFAFMLPIILLLILALIDIARAVEEENTLAFAAREGTRYAIVHGSGATTPVAYCGANTTSTTTITAGSRAATPVSMSGISVGTELLVDSAASTTSMETVSVTAVTSTTFTATFAKAHSGTWAVTAACTDPTISSVVQNTAIGVPSVTVVLGFPDSNNDRGSRVFIDATAPFVPLPSQYLLNGSLSITLRGGSMLVIQR